MSVCAPLIQSSAQNASVEVTKLGRRLRLTSLDELPQIFNILNGTMTFIGPRPCLATEFELVDLLCKVYEKILLLTPLFIGEFARERENIYSMTPGESGLAQVRGRDKNSLRNKVRYETFYMKRKSLLFDLHIIVLTMISF